MTNIQISAIPAPEGDPSWPWIRSQDAELAFELLEELGRLINQRPYLLDLPQAASIILAFYNAAHRRIYGISPGQFRDYRRLVNMLCDLLAAYAEDPPRDLHPIRHATRIVGVKILRFMLCANLDPAPDLVEEFCRDDRDPYNSVGQVLWLVHDWELIETPPTSFPNALQILHAGLRGEQKRLDREHRHYQAAMDRLHQYDKPASANEWMAQRTSPEPNPIDASSTFDGDEIETLEEGLWETPDMCERLAEYLEPNLLCLTFGLIYPPGLLKDRNWLIKQRCRLMGILTIPQEEEFGAPCRYRFLCRLLLLLISKLPVDQYEREVGWQSTDIWSIIDAARAGSHGSAGCGLAGDPEPRRDPLSNRKQPVTGDSSPNDLPVSPDPTTPESEPSDPAPEDLGKSS